MRIHQLKLTNFMSYTSCTLQLSIVSVCSIIGPNGSGKSSLIEAIIWTLFGYAKLPNRDLIHSGKDSMETEMVFELGGNQYHITRSFDTAMHLKLLVNGAEVAQGNNLQTEAIVKALGASKDLLLQSIAITQGQLSSFISAYPATRRDLIVDMLSLNRYNDAWEMAKKSQQDLSTTIQSHHQTMEVLNNQLKNMNSMTDIDKAIAEFKSRSEEISNNVNIMTARREHLLIQDREARGRLTELESKSKELLNQFSKSISEVGDSIRNIEGLVYQIDQGALQSDALVQSIKDLEGELSSVGVIFDHIKTLRAQVQQCEEEIQQRQEKLTFGSKATKACPMCGSELGEERWNNLLSTMKAEVAQLIGKRDQVGRELQTIKSPRNLEVVQRDIDSRRDKITRIEVGKESRQGYVDQIASLRQKREEIEKEFNIQSEHTKQDIESTKAQLNTEIDSLATTIKNQKTEQEKCSSGLLQWVSSKTARTSLEASVSEAQENLEHSREHLPNTEFIVSALSPTGIPLMIIDHYLPIIEQRAQTLLGRLSDGKLNVKLFVVESGQKKGVDIQAGSMHLRPIKALSGGEQTRVSLAIRLALSQILADISGCKFDCLLIDEPEYLDDDGVMKFVQEVSNLATQFSQIFVMSHLPEIKMALPQHILVEKQGNESTATIH